MKQFIYKTIIAVIAIVLVYELTIAKQFKEFTSQSEILFNHNLIVEIEGIEKPAMVCEWLNLSLINVKLYLFNSGVFFSVKKLFSFLDLGSDNKIFILDASIF